MGDYNFIMSKMLAGKNKSYCSSFLSLFFFFSVTLPAQEIRAQFMYCVTPLT